MPRGMMGGGAIGAPYAPQPSWLGSRLYIYAQSAGALGWLGSAPHARERLTIGAHTVAQSSGSIYREPITLEYDDGYWASVVFEDGLTIISSDIPPTRCAGREDPCDLDVIEVGEDLVRRLSEAMGARISRALLVCTNLMGRCSGVSVKIFVEEGAEKAAEIFGRSRLEVFNILGEAYGRL